MILPSSCALPEYCGPFQEHAAVVVFLQRAAVSLQNSQALQEHAAVWGEGDPCQPP